MSQSEKASRQPETWGDDAGCCSCCRKLCCPRSNACARKANNIQSHGGATSPKSSTVPTSPNPPVQVGQNARNSKLKIQGGTIFDSFPFMLVGPDIVEESMTMQVFLTEPNSGGMEGEWGVSTVCQNQREIEDSFKKEFKCDDDAWFCWDIGEGSHTAYFLIAAERLRLSQRDEVELARLIEETPAARERYDVDHVSIITQAFRCASYARVYILAKSKGKLFASFNSKAEKGKQWVVRRTFDGAIRVKSRPFESEKERQYCPLASPRSVSRTKPPVYPLGTKEETLTTRMTVIKLEGGGSGAGGANIHIRPGKGSARNKKLKGSGDSGSSGLPTRRRSDEDPGLGGNLTSTRVKEAKEKTTANIRQHGGQELSGRADKGENRLSRPVTGEQPEAHGDESQRQRTSGSVATPPKDPAEYKQGLVSPRTSGTSTESAPKEGERSEAGTMITVIPGGTSTSIVNKQESEVKTPTDVQQHDISVTTDHSSSSESAGITRNKDPGELGDEQSVEVNSEESLDGSSHEKNIRIRMKNAASTSFQIAIDEEPAAGQTAPKLVTVSPGETFEYRQSLETTRRGHTPTVNPSNDAESLLTLRVAVDDSSGHRRRGVTDSVLRVRGGGVYISITNDGE